MEAVWHWTHQWSYCTLGSVSTEFGDRLQMGRLPHCVTSHAGQLILQLIRMVNKYWPNVVMFWLIPLWINKCVDGR